MSPKIFAHRSGNVPTDAPAEHEIVEGTGMRDVADIYPGIKGEESVFVERTASGADVIYLKVADYRKNRLQGYHYQRLASVASGEIRSVAFKHLDRDDKLDVEFTLHSSEPDASAEASTRSFQIYQKEFAWESSRLLGVTLNMLYSEDASICDELPKPINEMEFPECAPVEYDETDRAELARGNLEWRVQQAEWQLRRNQTDLRRLKEQEEDLAFRVGRLETPKDACDSVPASAQRISEDAPEGMDALEWRVQRLEMDLRRMESDLRFLSLDLNALESRVRKLEDRVLTTEYASSGADVATSSGLYGDTEERVEDLESRMDDIESRVDDLEDR